VGDGFFDRGDAEICGHRDRHALRQDATCGPIDHGGEVDNAFRHRDVSDVHHPDVMGPRDCQTAQQLRIDFGSGMAPTDVGLALHRRDAHAPQLDLMKKVLY